MRFEEKLKKLPTEDVWNEYCGFLDLSVKEYMDIQKRLLMEQIGLLGQCGLGKMLFKNNQVPKSMEEFRETVPLTSFGDYASLLLSKRMDVLPAKPVLWLQTTWEGGDTPAKVAPYSESMLRTYRKNVMAATILANSTARGRFRIKHNPKILYNLAPMPYVTGMIPDILLSEMKIRFLPPPKEAKKMSFSQKSKRGFELGIQGGIDMLFGLSGVLQGVSKLFDSSGGSVKLSSLLRMSPARIVKLAAAKYRSKRDGKPILPKDLFSLKALVCVGTDSVLYKEELEEAWGIRPLEVFGGTEPSLMGTETWSKNGLVFFPDVCFYEFIPENEMLRSIRQKGYQPKTYLMDEVVANQKYELVITVLKGGAFARYRAGDVYRCVRIKNKNDKLDLPQFEYVDRVPTVIDIAGFTRITEKEIQTVIDLSSLPISQWFALKEYDSNNHSYMHLYLETSNETVENIALTPRIIKEHMNVYFRYYDGDYKDLKKMLGIDPLRITLLKSGTIQRYKDLFGISIPKINPSREEVIEMLRIQNDNTKKAVLSCE